LAHDICPAVYLSRVSDVGRVLDIFNIILFEDLLDRRLVISGSAFLDVTMDVLVGRVFSRRKWFQRTVRLDLYERETFGCKISREDLDGLILYAGSEELRE
jgi:hypothetical protein